ncbi:transposase, TnpA family [Photorhabdus khanii NC19]|uniref:Transposase, TnpA family n=1 Tax=Photorhabdus khanii NC19 TaxID=1004151 RepID=W3V5D6_9GAMM|nr:transposase, TnpA family [Photorhabdus khanii NC19]
MVRTVRRRQSKEAETDMPDLQKLPRHISTLPVFQADPNKGEYRHKLPRWIFFANQGEFTTGDYEEIMNKASVLSLVSNAILYWNTSRISNIVKGLRENGEVIDDDVLAHISLLPYKHVLPHGTYFVDGEPYGTEPTDRAKP